MAMARKLYIAVVVLALLVSAGAAVYALAVRDSGNDSSAISHTPGQTPDDTDDDGPGTPITVTGTYECLPKRDTSGPQTMECAFGIKQDDGVHYALRFDEQARLTDFVAGKRARITGVFREQVTQYDTAGTIEVQAIESL